MKPNLYRLAIAGVFATVIVVISPNLASAEASICPSPPHGLSNFSPTTPPADLKPGGFDEITADGKTIRRTLEDYRGQAVVMNFWATWCAPCVREMPALDRLAALVAKDGIRVLTVSLDRKGASIVKKFYRVNGIKNLPVHLDRGSKYSRANKVQALPSTLMIGRDGREVGRVLGVAEWDGRETVSFLNQCFSTPPSATQKATIDAN